MPENDVPFIGQIFWEYGLGDSPETFQRVCQVFDISGVGEASTLEDVTTFCSGGSREYIAGLADGMEPTIQLNYEANNTYITALIAHQKAKTVRTYRLAVEGGSPVQYLTFSAVPLSWNLGPSVDGKNTIEFGYKISGEVVFS